MTPTSKAAAPARGVANPALGHVDFVTARRAYLDRGAADGMAARQVVAMARDGRPIGSCTIETVGEHQATCQGAARLRAGDTFRPGARVVRKQPAPGPPLPPIVDEQTLRARAATIADAGIEKVDFSGERGARGRGVAEVGTGFGAWTSQNDPQGGTYAQERIDGAIRGAAIGNTGFRFDGAFSAVRWNQLPLGGPRFRPGVPTQFYLWEAEATRRQLEGGTTVAIGRIWPYHAPGLTLLDGVQMGRQNESRSAEGGVYGGLLPSVESLAPSFDIWAAGVYGALSQVGSRTSTVRLARQEARVGIWRGLATGVVSEAEGLVQAWIGPLTIGGGGRLRWATEVDRGGPVVEIGYLDATVQPSLHARAGLHVRYLGTMLLSDAPLRGETPLIGGQLHALADGQLVVSPHLALAASAGADREAEADLHLFHGGAEVRFARLFGESGGVWVGGQVEQGWLQGASVYVQGLGRVADRVQLVARLSGNATRFETPTVVWNVHELSAALNADGALTPWLRLRAFATLLTPLLVQAERGFTPSLGSIVGISLAGSI